MPPSSRTDANLQVALAGEADANRRYLAYGIRALAEGRADVAQLFFEAAGAETIHALEHLRAMGAVGSTRENLVIAATGEMQEIDVTLPRMIREADEDGRPDAAASFRLALERERHHRDMFRHALRARGFKSVRILKGGLGGWTNARLPVESKSYLPSIGLEIYKNLTLGDLERRTFKAGEIIFKEGADAKGEAFLIHAGSVQIKRVFDGVEKVLSTLGEGELVGELALFREAPRSADAIAATDVELIVINNDRLDWLMQNRPQVAREMVRRLSEWVVRTDRERALSNR